MAGLGFLVESDCLLPALVVGETPAWPQGEKQENLSAQNPSSGLT